FQAIGSPATPGLLLRCDLVPGFRRPTGSRCSALGLAGLRIEFDPPRLRSELRWPSPGMSPAPTLRAACGKIRQGRRSGAYAVPAHRLCARLRPGPFLLPWARVAATGCDTSKWIRRAEQSAYIRRAGRNLRGDEWESAFPHDKWAPLLPALRSRSASRSRSLALGARLPDRDVPHDDDGVPARAVFLPPNQGLPWTKLRSPRLPLAPQEQRHLLGQLRTPPRSRVLQRQTPL